jgi:hypothetical protein
MAGALRACPKSNERDVEPLASIKRDDQTMFPITRRQALAASGGFLTSLLAPRRFAAAATGGTLNIAYNVNLPSFDPNTGPSSVNPTLQSIYRSVFNNYIGPRPDLLLSLLCSRLGAGTKTKPKCGWTSGTMCSGTTAAD